MSRAKSSYTKCLRRRLEYLTEKLNGIPAGDFKTRIGWIKQEIAALNWALPVLEAELAAQKAVHE